MAAKKQAPSKAVDEYIAAAAPAFRPLLKQLRKTIRAAAPEAEEVISYKIPAYKQNGMLVYFAAYDDHCSFFPGSGAVRKKFAKELAPFEGGKSTVHFTPDHPVPSRLVTRIVKWRLTENASRRAAAKSSRRR